MDEYELLTKVPPEDWRERIDAMDQEQRDEEERALDNLIQRAVLLTRYLAHRNFGMCHLAAGDAAFNDVTKVREILGYSYPERHFHHVPWC